MQLIDSSLQLDSERHADDEKCLLPTLDTLSDDEPPFTTKQVANRGPLTEQERAKLKHCESVIERGLQTFVMDRLNMTARRAYQLSEEATVVENLRNVNNCSQKNPVVEPEVLPANEAQARSLSKLPKAEQSAAWQEALNSVDGKQPTAKLVKQMVAKRKNKGDLETKPDRMAKSPEVQPVHLDPDTEIQKVIRYLEQERRRWPDEHRPHLMAKLQELINSWTA